jgi:hypothetical protein
VLAPYGLRGTKISLVRLEGLYNFVLYNTKPARILSFVSKPFYVFLFLELVN